MLYLTLNQRDAERAAYLHLVAKLHEQGTIESMRAPDKIDNQTMKEEKDAVVDIYDYAAKYGCVPIVSSAQGPKSRSGRTIDVTIEMPEQNIRVQGRSRTFRMAQVVASLKFRKEAERYHSEQGTESLVVKDSTALSTSNIRAFYEFCRTENRFFKLRVETKRAEDYIIGQTFLDDNPIGNEVKVGNKKKTEEVAELVAAVELTKRDPDLLPRFLGALKRGNGKILPLVPRIDMPLEDGTLTLMRETLSSARRAGLAAVDDDPNDDVVDKLREYRPSQRLQPAEIDIRSSLLLKKYEEYLKRPDLELLRKARADLPMNQHAHEVLEIIGNNTYCIVIGATGSGKTTQVPQILLEDAVKRGEGGACNIICTQPRRIAASSVARRVADERAEPLQNSVGYHVRFDYKPPRNGGSINYCTTGILLQQLQHQPDDVLDAASHLIIDEVHERDILIDFLLIILKKVMAQRIKLGKSTPKVVLMSATMDADLFASYFKSVDSNSRLLECPTLSVPGRTFPVQEQYLETILASLDSKYGTDKLRSMYRDIPSKDYFTVEKDFVKNGPLAMSNGSVPKTGANENAGIIDWKKERTLTKSGETVVSNESEDALVPHGLVGTTIAHITKTSDDGAILVFLPGLEEITKVEAILREQKPLGIDFTDLSNYQIIKLHSSIRDTQKTVFDPVPQGCRKIILGTNIAETSITIPDVKYVVDTGKIREKNYDQSSRITKLQCTWISKSNAKQRAGRAGRVQNGHYYALYTKSRYESFRAVGLPELLRSDLQEICLAIKAQAFKTPIRQFLADAIEPPQEKAVDIAVDNLEDLDCLTKDETLTPLGRLLASLPVHPALGKMIVLGVIFRCLDPMLILGAASEERDIFVNPREARQEASQAKKTFVRGSESDHYALLCAFTEMRHIQQTKGDYAFRAFCHKHFLHPGAYKTITGTAQQIEEVLVAAGLIPAAPVQSRIDYQFGHPSLNENSNKVSLIKALLFAGLYPNLAVNTSHVLYRTPSEKNTIIHPSSVNGEKFKGGQRERVDTRSPKLVAYSEMAKSNDGNSMFLRHTTQITPLMASLFGGHLHSTDPRTPLVEMDNWLPFFLKGQDRHLAATLIDFRKGLERMQAHAFKQLSSKKLLTDNPVREIFAQGIVEILNFDVRPTVNSKPVNKWADVVSDWKKGVAEDKGAGFADYPLDDPWKQQHQQYAYK